MPKIPNPDKEEPDIVKDNQAFNKYPTAQEVTDFHRNADTDKRRESIHHTAGAAPYQVAPGDHIHDGIGSEKLWDGMTVTGSRNTGAAITSLLQILATQGIIDGTTT